MGDIDNMLALIAKLDKIEALNYKVDELTNKLNKLEAELSEIKKEALSNKILNDTKSNELSVADLAILEYKKNPPKIGG